MHLATLFRGFPFSHSSMCLIFSLFMPMILGKMKKHIYRNSLKKIPLTYTLDLILLHIYCEGSYIGNHHSSSKTRHRWLLVKLNPHIVPWCDLFLFLSFRSHYFLPALILTLLCQLLLASFNHILLCDWKTIDNFFIKQKYWMQVILLLKLKWLCEIKCEIKVWFI